MREIERAETDWVSADYRRGMKAWRLAPTIDVCRALLAGQYVPRQALDPEWARRYGL